MRYDRCPTRIEPVPPGQWDERLTRLLTASPGGTEEPMHLFTTLAHQPELFRRWLGFGGALLAGRLPGRLRELVILRTAYRFDARYEWAHHIELAEAQGISGAEVAALGGDLAALDWDPFERAALAAVDETKDAGAVSDGTWSVLASHPRPGRSDRARHARGALRHVVHRAALVAPAGRALGRPRWPKGSPGGPPG